MNKVELMGRLTKDIELKTMKSKKKSEKRKYAKFTLAVPRKMNREETDFIDCVAFGKVAEVIKKYVSKGLRIIIIGSLQISSYENDEGEKRKSVSIIVEDFYFVDFNKDIDEDEDEEDEEDSKKKKSSKKKSSKKKDEDEDDEEDEDEDDEDLPF